MKPRQIFWLAVALSIPAAVQLLYFTTRSNFATVAGLFALLFVLYIIACRSTSNIKFGEILTAGILLRLTAVFALPNLSDDYFRFLWDGMLMSNGDNPFQYVPAEQPVISDYGKYLLQHMNSAHYYSVYPPVLQYLFTLAATLFPGQVWPQVVLLKGAVLLAELVSIILLRLLIRQLKQDERQVKWYALNPLVINELTGNVHFEAFMILFTLVTLYLVFTNRLLIAAGVFALAVCSKLLPLVWLPAILFYIGWRKSIGFAITVAAVCAVLFLPLVSFELLQHMFKSIGLYFQTFEFNASIYFLCRWIGYQLWGYNQIKFIGLALSVLSLLVIIFISLNRKISLQQKMLLILFIYLLLSTTVHPWYVVPLVAVGVLTKYNFPILFSALAVVSYGVYRTTPFNENLLLVAVEYTAVIAYAVYEVLNDGKRKNIIPSEA